MSATKLKVVIIGGGYGGAQLARLLDKTNAFDITLIDKRPTFFHSIGSLRTLVDKSFVSKLFIPYEKLIKNGRFMRAEVEEVTEDGVKLKGEEKEVKFDYLVVSTGSHLRFPFPFPFDDVETAKKHFESIHDKVKAAKSILVVGGGPTGIETVGELKHAYPDKKITLVHGGTVQSFDSFPSENHLLSDFFPLKLREKILYKLRHEVKAEVLLGETVATPQGQFFFDDTSKKYQTKSGKEIEADLAFFCIGGGPNNSVLQKNFSSSLSERGYAKVNGLLQLQNHEKIFIIGDLVDLSEGKMAGMAKFQGEFVAKVLQELSKGKIPKNAYKPNGPMMVVTIGPKNGAGVLFGFVIGKTLPVMLKGKDFMTSQCWKNFNLTIPQ